MMTELDKLLQEVAQKDWEYFCDLVGQRAIRKAKVCVLRKQKKSLNQISLRLGITQKEARIPCTPCKNTLPETG